MSIADETGAGGTGSTSGDQGGASQKMQDVKAMASEKVGQVREQASAMYDKGKEKAGELRQQASAVYDQGRDKAQQYYEQGMSAAQEYYSDGKERAKEFEENVEQYIRQKPIQSVLIAVGVGALLGALLKR